MLSKSAVSLLCLLSLAGGGAHANPSENPFTSQDPLLGAAYDLGGDQASLAVAKSQRDLVGAPKGFLTVSDKRQAFVRTVDQGCQNPPTDHEFFAYATDRNDITLSALAIEFQWLCHWNTPTVDKVYDFWAISGKERPFGFDEVVWSLALHAAQEISTCTPANLSSDCLKRSLKVLSLDHTEAIHGFLHGVGVLPESTMPRTLQVFVNHVLPTLPNKMRLLVWAKSILEFAQNRHLDLEPLLRSLENLTTTLDTSTTKDLVSTQLTLYKTAHLLETFGAEHLANAIKSRDSHKSITEALATLGQGRALKLLTEAKPFVEAQSNRYAKDYLPIIQKNVLALIHDKLESDSRTGDPDLSREPTSPLSPKDGNGFSEKMSLFNMILNSSTSSPISRGVLLTGSFGNGFWSQTSTWGTVVPVSLEDGDTPSEALERTERTLKVQLGYPEEDGPSIYPEPESADSTSQRVLDGAWNLLFTGAFLGNREALSPLVHGTLDTLPELDFFSIKSRIQVDLSSPAVAELTARRLGIPQDAHGRWALIQRLWASPRSAEDLRTVFARPEALRGEDRG